MMIVRQEKGVALILALVMLALLGVLGALSLSTSTTELRITGNYRNAEAAFYTAEAALAYAQTDPAIYTLINPGVVDSWPNVADPALATYTNPVAIGANQARVRVEWIASGSLPPGSGYSAEESDKFIAEYYVITATGNGPNNAQSSLESQLIRVVPK